MKCVVVHPRNHTGVVFVCVCVVCVRVHTCTQVNLPVFHIQVEARGSCSGSFSVTRHLMFGGTGSLTGPGAHHIC